MREQVAGELGNHLDPRLVRLHLSRAARTIPFVAACARVGPDASLSANSCAASSESLVGEYAIDDVPALERGGVVQLRGHHQLARSRRPGTLGESLCATHRRRQADNGLDESKPRRLGGQQHVAAERQLERRGQAERVSGKHGGQRKLLHSVHDLKQTAPTWPRPARW